MDVCAIYGFCVGCKSFHYSNPSLAQTNIDRLATSTNLYMTTIDGTEQTVGVGVVWSTASRPVASVKLLLLDTCVSYQADTSRIVQQSHTSYGNLSLEQY